MNENIWNQRNYPCNGGSEWEFIQSFYLRVHDSERREKNANAIAAATVGQSRVLAEKLDKCQKELDDTRMEMKRYNAELDYEKERCNELNRNLTYAYEAHEECGKLADGLRAELAALKGDPAPASEGIVPTTAELILNLTFGKKKIEYLESLLSANEDGRPLEGIDEIIALRLQTDRQQHELKQLNHELMDARSNTNNLNTSNVDENKRKNRKKAPRRQKSTADAM